MDRWFLAVTGVFWGLTPTGVFCSSNSDRCILWLWPWQVYSVALTDLKGMFCVLGGVLHRYVLLWHWYDVNVLCAVWKQIFVLCSGWHWHTWRMCSLIQHWFWCWTNCSRSDSVSFLFCLILTGSFSVLTCCFLCCLTLSGLTDVVSFLRLVWMLMAVSETKIFVPSSDTVHVLCVWNQQAWRMHGASGERRQHRC